MLLLSIKALTSYNFNIYKFVFLLLVNLTLTSFDFIKDRAEFRSDTKMEIPDSRMFPDDEQRRFKCRHEIERLALHRPAQETKRRNRRIDENPNRQKPSTRSNVRC